MNEDEQAVALCAKIYRVCAKIRELHEEDEDAASEFNRIARQIEDKADELYAVEVLVKCSGCQKLTEYGICIDCQSEEITK